MKWTLNEAKYGDIVRVKLGDIYHYGIYVSEEEVIQFGLPPTNLTRNSSDIEVCSSDIDTFLAGKFLEVEECDKKEKKTRKSKEETVKEARSRLGEKGYHILHNNCEHFAYSCAFGKKVCSQVDAVKDFWRAFPFVNVYIKEIPDNLEITKVYPKERQEEINACTNQAVINEKYFVWKVLEHGIKNSLGIDFKDIEFTKNGDKWECNKCKFSLSHSHNIVAVAVARNDIGIDIEKINTDKFSKLKTEKLLTNEELKDYENAEDKNLFLNQIWTVKEALFKQGNEKAFVPNKVQTKGETYCTSKVESNDEKYFISLASKDLKLVKFHLLNDNLKINKV